MKCPPWWLGLAALVGCQPAEQASLPARALPVAASCDVTLAPCAARGAGEAITLQLGPPVSALTPFPVVVDVQGLQPRAVTVEFSMPGMDMGRNRYRLTQTGSIAWACHCPAPASVRVMGDDAQVTAEFPFHAEGEQ